MSVQYHPDDTDAVEKLHARFLSDNNLNDRLIEFQDAAYAMGRARGLLDAERQVGELREQLYNAESDARNASALLAEVVEWFDDGVGRSPEEFKLIRKIDRWLHGSEAEGKDHD